MIPLLILNARVLTMLAPGETRPPTGGRRGDSLGTLGILPSADVLIVDGKIAEVAPHGAPPSELRRSLDQSLLPLPAGGRVLMPGFVDCHTHACWAGSRIDEWEKKLAGATYQQIMAAGGGIMSTVRAVREAKWESLVARLVKSIEEMIPLGITTLEVKSGYGLSAEHELKMLQAIMHVGQVGGKWRGVTVVPTALLGHAIEGDSGGFVNQTISETLPAVTRAHPGITVDAYCENGAWSVEDCTRLFVAARASGHPIRLHADQFTSLGMVEKAIALGARSVDHLEASTPDTLRAIASSETFGVGLPVCGFHLDGRFAALGKLANAGGKVCIATNFNPGSAPSPSMPFAIALAVRHCGLTPAQAIGAATVNPAALLGLADRGYIGVGARADLILLGTGDERVLAYEVGNNPVDVVLIGGEPII